LDGRVWDFAAVPQQYVERQVLPGADNQRSSDRPGTTTANGPKADGLLSGAQFSLAAAF
jgi:hypothetical protein